MAKISKYITAVSLNIIKLYQFTISPLMASHCRFHPSCSSYAVEAIEMHGITRGFLLILKRIGCCHPWHMGGYDPVPPLQINEINNG